MTNELATSQVTYDDDGMLNIWTPMEVPKPTPGFKALWIKSERSVGDWAADYIAAKCVVRKWVDGKTTAAPDHAITNDAVSDALAAVSQPTSLRGMCGRMG